MHNRQPFHGNLEEQVPYALQNLFSAIVSEQIAEEGLYSYLLSNLLASLEGVHSMVCADKYKLLSLTVIPKFYMSFNFLLFSVK